MKIRTEFFKKGEACKVAADIALKNRLYVPGFWLSGELKKIREYGDTSIVISFDENNVPIGVAIPKSCYWGNQLWIFVRKSKRRMGVGTDLVNTLKNHESFFGHYNTSKGSIEFFNKLNLKF